MANVSIVVEKIVKNINTKSKGQTAFSLNFDSLKGDILQSFSTSLPSLDVVCSLDKQGNFGLPRGKMISIFGVPQSGKSTLASQICASIPNALIHWFDTERATLPGYIVTLGINPDNILIDYPRTLEETHESLLIGLQTYDKFIQDKGMSYSDMPYIAVIDSMSAVPSRRELGFDESDEQKKKIKVGGTPPSRASVISSGLASITGPLGDCQAILLMISHEKVNVKMSQYEAGPSYGFIGGRAIEFHAAIQLRLKPRAQLKESNFIYGRNIDIVVTKNRTGIYPYKKVEGLEIIFGRGFDGIKSLLNLCLDTGILVRSGNSYERTSNSEKSSMSAVFQKMMDDKDFFNELKQECFGFIYKLHKELKW